MTFEEIIQRLKDRDDRVTKCFFFWDGPTLQHIEELRKTNPRQAALLPKPVCVTCRPGLLKVLHKLYGPNHFNYNELVTDFYFYLMSDDKLSTIQDARALMGWIVTTAYYFFLHEKIRNDKALQNPSLDSLLVRGLDVESDEGAAQAREFVDEVIKAMPNRSYAKILNEVSLEVAQYKGQEKSEKMQALSRQLDIPLDNLYVKVSLARKQFKETARRMKLV